jgi:hypothetical protein
MLILLSCIAFATHKQSQSQREACETSALALAPQLKETLSTVFGKESPLVIFK